LAGRIQAKLWDVALDHYGYVTTEDARRLGINVVELGKLAYRKQLGRVAYGIYRFEQLPVSQFDPYMLATLWAGGRGVLSHDTAMELYELSDINPDKIHLTVPDGYRPRRQGGEFYEVHHENLNESQIRRHEGIPIVTVPIAIDQAIRTGVPTHLVRQALTTARERGAITKAEHRDLMRRLEARR
jgi:predicted transcriptional regulator of viral defense system